MQHFSERLVSQPLLFLPFFVFIWVLASYVIALIGGWRALAGRDAAGAAEFTGEKWSMQSGRMRWTTRYNGALTVGANAEGLYLGVLFMFRVGHPPLYVPWTAVSLRENRGLVFTYITIDFLEEPGISLTVSRQLGEKIAKAGQQQIRG
jgi:hypothetical protein